MKGSNEEVAQYLTTFKAYEHKGDETLKERVHQSYHEQLQHVLISGKKVNKTDADNLASQFGVRFPTCGMSTRIMLIMLQSFANITSQPSKVLSNVKGLAAVKITSLVDAFNKPFLVGGLRRPEEPIRQAKGFEPPQSYENNDPGTEEQEPVASPDWPDESDGSDVPFRSSPRGKGPSRSPGLSPEPQDGGGRDGDTTRGAHAWHDPLDDGEDGEDGEGEIDGVNGENGLDEPRDGPASKRARLDR